MIDLRTLFALTLRRPSEAARELLALPMTPSLLAMAFGVVVAANAVISFASLRAVPPPPEMASIMQAVTPFGFATFVAVSLMAVAGALTLSGRLLGGTARFSQMLLMLLWIQAVMLVFEILLIVAMAVVPVLAAIAVLPVYALMLVLMVVFVQIAHGFAGPWPAIGSFAIGLVGLGFVLQLLFLV